MASRVVEMWRWQGAIDRRTYAVAGGSAFILKYLLDKFVAFAVFDRPWFLWSYWRPLEPDALLNAIPYDTRAFAGAPLVLSLPFIWLGVTLTVQRLRDAGKPLWLVVLFFVPVINILFFLLLCAMGSHSVTAQTCSNAVAGDAQAGSVDSTGRDGGSGHVNRDDHCDWFNVYSIGYRGASVLRVGVVCGVAVLPWVVFGAGIQLSRATVV